MHIHSPFYFFSTNFNLILGALNQLAYLMKMCRYFITHIEEKIYSLRGRPPSLIAPSELVVTRTLCSPGLWIDKMLKWTVDSSGIRGPRAAQFLKSTVQHGMAGFSSQGITRLKSMCRLGWVVIWRFWGKICLLRSFLLLAEFNSCGYSTEVPDSLPVVCQGLLCAFRSCLHSLSYGPSIFKSEMEHWNPSRASNLWLTLFTNLCVCVCFVYTKFIGES